MNIKQIIIKDKKVYCTTYNPYPNEIIKNMIKSGYKVKEIKNGKERYIK